MFRSWMSIALKKLGHYLIAAYLLVCSGCVERHQPANVGLIYKAAAKYESPRRRPVIVIPGILGSKLKQVGTDRVVWGAFSGDYADPGTPEGARLIALPMREGVPLSELQDDVVPNGALDRVKLAILGLPVQLNAYYNVLVTLGVGGFRDQQLSEAGAVDYGEDHFTCFQFAYDWRRSNAENAALLKRFIEERREYITKQYQRVFGPGEYDVKFNIVAHSMGGLVTRYFLRYGDAPLPADGSLPELTWAGAEYVEKAVLVGTPNAGSVYSLEQLVHGSQPAPIVSPYSAAVLGTMPSVYELMPRGRHGVVVENDAPSKRVENLTNIETWKHYGWGLLNSDQREQLERLLPEVRDASDRSKIAEDHLQKCLTNAERFWAALDRPATPPAGLSLILFAGDAEETAEVLSVDPADGSLSTFATGPGDGTVTRYSALMDERQGRDYQPGLNSPISWRNVTFLFEDHIGLTKAESFSDNVLFQLLER